MSYERNPNDPYQRDLAENATRRAAQFDQELQPDPELAEGPASNGRIALFAIAVAVVLGAVFYGLNNSSTDTSTASQTAPATQNTAQNNASKPPVAPGVRDVTPSNTQPGMTTGAAPAPKPVQPPAAAQPQSDTNPTPGATK